MHDVLADLNKALRNIGDTKPPTVAVHIDDLLGILRAARALGYDTQRDPYILPTLPGGRRKRSIWHVRRDGVLMVKFYVDTTRSIPRGIIFEMPKPPEPPKLELRVESIVDTNARLDSIMFSLRSLYQSWHDVDYLLRDV